MNSKLKRIVAREGLIIIFLVIIAAICIFLSDWQSTHISKHPFISQKELQSILSQVKKIDEKHIVCPNGQKAEFDSQPDSQDIYWACQYSKSGEPQKFSDKELYDMAGIQKEERPIIQRIDFSKWVIFFLLAVYPVYLFFRFVLWAIRTLKQKQ